MRPYSFVRPYTQLLFVCFKLGGGTQTDLSLSQAVGCVFQGVVQVEQRLGGRLVDKPKQIPFQDGGHNLCLTIEELSAGWRSKLAASYQVTNRCISLACTLCLSLCSVPI